MQHAVQQMFSMHLETSHCVCTANTNVYLVFPSSFQLASPTCAHIYILSEEL